MIAFVMLALPAELIENRHACEFDGHMASVVELLRQFSRSGDEERWLALRQAVEMIGQPVTSPTSAQRSKERAFDEYFGVERVSGNLLPVTLLNIAKTYQALMPAYLAQRGGAKDEEWRVLIEGFDLILDVNIEYLSREARHE